jgi:hypothetical protein
VSVLELRMDVAFAHALRVVARGRLAEARPDVCLFLADRYWRLAAHHASRGRIRAARRHEAKAERYYVSGGGEHPPPLATAAALPVPSRPALWAFAGRPGPPDAA